jgi:hypothetical protein
MHGAERADVGDLSAPALQRRQETVVGAAQRQTNLAMEVSRCWEAVT